MKNFIKTLGMGLLPAFGIAMTGCGGAANLGQHVQVILDPANQAAKVEVELSNGLQVNMAQGQYLIQNKWGHLYFADATKTTNAKIGIEVDLSQIVAGHMNFSSISTLPNGAPLPVALTPPLFQIPVMKSSSFDLKAAVSLTPELQIGALVGIKAFSSQYVIPGVAVCQNFRNASNAAFAAVCIYGPSANSSTPGGIFIGGTFGNVIPSTLLSNSEPVATNMAIRSSVFTMAAPANNTNFSGLNLTAQNISSDQFEEAFHDPKNQMNTNLGLKALRNIQKVLKVRN